MLTPYISNLECLPLLDFLVTGTKGPFSYLYRNFWLCNSGCWQQVHGESACRVVGYFWKLFLHYTRTLVTTWLYKDMAIDHINIEPKQNVFPTQLSLAGFTTLLHVQSPPDMRESLMQRKKEWKVITGLIDYIQNIFLLQMCLETWLGKQGPLPVPWTKPLQGRNP